MNVIEIIQLKYCLYILHFMDTMCIYYTYCKLNQQCTNIIKIVLFSHQVLLLFCFDQIRKNSPRQNQIYCFHYWISLSFVYLYFLQNASSSIFHKKIRNYRILANFFLAFFILIKHSKIAYLEKLSLSSKVIQGHLRPFYIKISNISCIFL